MPKTLFFYDLETSGLNPREDRIMQFAGQRTDTKLNSIGESYNTLVKMSEDVLPNPEALLVTGITPQQTIENGYSEAEFSHFLMEEIFKPDTIAIGFNNIRFDDEFIRHLFWRNFFDPYEWAWKNGRSRWDILDTIRMTRALRPEGIEWPVDNSGQATNRLELMAKVNRLNHFKAHDASSDVEALIAITKLIRKRQPKLYDYLFTMRDKNAIKKIVNLDDKQPFVYTSGRYDSKFNKTTAAFPLTAGKNGNIIVYDLRVNPTSYLDLSEKELKKIMLASREQRQQNDYMTLPVKELQYNRAPAVAPLGVLNQLDGWKKINLTPEIINKHKNILLKASHFAENIRSLFENREEFAKSSDPEAQLYDGFLNDLDRLRTEAVRSTKEQALVELHPEFSDERLEPLLLHFKARNYPSTLSQDEVIKWEIWRNRKIQIVLPGFMRSLQRLANTVTDKNQLFILKELQLWAESIAPTDVSDQTSFKLS
jgi:exodeoxyribonuclease-1